MQPAHGAPLTTHVHAAATVSAAAADDVNRVMSETRRHFVGAFTSQCDTILALADRAGAEPSSIDEATSLLHRMAGLGGTLGFHRVSARAAVLEDALGTSSVAPGELRDRVATLHIALAQDMAGPILESPAPLPTVRSQGPPLTVLLVEDEPVQRMITAAQIRKAGHTPVEAKSGEEAVDAARATRPDVILLDVELPGISGHDVCRILKADPDLAAIPVAFLSAHSDLDDRLAGLCHGADDFLTKPIDPRELAVRLQLLTRHAPHRDDGEAGSVLTYEAFCDRTRQQLRRDRGALALIRTPVGKAADAAGITREEIRRRDLCGEYDRSHVGVFLPDSSGTAARDRIGSIVEKCRLKGLDGVYAGIAASPAAASRTLDELLEEADEALAVARYENLTVALRPDGPRETAQTDTASPLVLVGDDDPDVVRILDAHLAAGGYRRVLTFDGRRTLEEVRAQRPDVLVVDLMMPRMTGFDVLAGLRDLGDARPRVIVLSARGREDDILRAFSLGADDFMAKPFNPQELLARIARLVR